MDVKNAKKAAFAFCDPAGLVGVAVASNDVATNLELYTKAPGAGNNPWVGTATGTDAKSDTITAAQLTEGGFCCNALYYSTDGVGRAAYKAGGASGGVTFKGTGSTSAFTPPLSGGNMAAED